MGYFPNGTAGMDFQERFCLRCVNHRDLDDGRGEGCAVWDAHLIAPSQHPEHAKSEFERGQAEATQLLLGVLIEKKGLDNDCKLFQERVGVAPVDQLRLPWP